MEPPGLASLGNLPGQSLTRARPSTSACVQGGDAARGRQQDTTTHSRQEAKGILGKSSPVVLMGTRVPLGSHSQRAKKKQFKKSKRNQEEGMRHKHRHTTPAFPSLLANSLLIKQELKNYPNGAPFKHKPQGPLLIAQLLLQSQPRMMQQVHGLPLPAALAHSELCPLLPTGIYSTVSPWAPPSVLAPGSQTPA